MVMFHTNQYGNRVLKEDYDTWFEENQESLTEEWVEIHGEIESSIEEARFHNWSYDQWRML